MKKQLSLLLLAACMALSGTIGAQPTVVTVGNGTTAGYYAPFNNYYKYSYNQMVYNSQTLTDAGMTAGYIGGIAYDCAAVGDLTLDEVYIYMGTSNSATIAGTAASNLVPMANLTQVFHATDFAMPSHVGWFPIILDTPFEYDPATDGSLVIVVRKKASAYASGLTFRYTSTTNAMAYCNSDSDTNYFYFPTSTTTRSTYLPNIQFTVNSSADFCFPPSGFAIDDISSNGIGVSWNSSTAAYYQIAIAGAADAFDPSTAAWNTLTDTSYSFNNLTPATAYNVYLRAYCGDGFSATSVIPITTTAIPATLPYLGTFEDSDTSSWIFDNSTALNVWVIDTAAHCGEYSERALYISNDDGAHNQFAGGSYAHILAYRPITVDQDGAYDVSFDWRCLGYTSNTYNHIRAALVPTSIPLPAANAVAAVLSGISTTALPSGYIPIDGGSALNGSASWKTQRCAVNLTAGTYNILFYWYNYSTASYAMNPPAAIDNISIMASVCPGVDSVDWVTTETTAEITAFYSGSPSELMLIYKARDAQNPDTVYSYDGSFELYDIAASSYYDATIYTICGSDTTYAPFNFNFQTDCAVISEFPWDYGFEGAAWFHYTSGCTTMYWPYCWNAANKGGSTTYNWRSYTSGSYAHSGDAAAYFYSTTTVSAQAGLDEWLKTPTVELSGNEQLSFWIRSYTTTSTANYHNRVSVRVSPEDTLDADSLYVNVPLSGGPTCNGGYYTDLTGTTYTQYFADLRGLYGNRRIAFVVDTNSYSFYMDDLRLFTVSNCPDALDPRVENYSSTTATLAWGDTATNPTTSAWDLYVGLAGFSADTVSPITIYDTTYTVEYLLPQTDYEFFVIAHCSDGSSANATTPVAFTTACDPFPADSLPYVEDFESYGSGSTNPINPCWTRQTFGSTTSYPYPSSSAAINGIRGLHCYASTSSTLGTAPIYEYAALPMFESDLNMLRLRFNSKRYSSTTSTYKSRLYVGVMSNPNDLSTFDTVAFIDHTDDPAGTITAEEIFFDQYEGEGGYITFLIPAPGAGQYNYIYIDDVVVDSIPECRRSTNLLAENITINSADLSWSNNSVVSVGSYTVAYSTDPDFNPDTCTTTVTVYDTNASLTGLNSYTHYYWSVRPDCSDNAEWAHKASFMTFFDCGEGNVVNILDTIGNGTSTSSTYPFYASTTYPLGFNYIIYTAQELSEMGVFADNRLNSISLHTGSTGGTINGISIYVTETDLESFSTTYASDTVPMSEMQLVFSGSKTFTANSWNEIFFDSAFTFSGSRNLMFLFRRDTVSSAAVSFFYTSTSPTYLADYAYTNTTGTHSISRTYSRANIAFNICSTIPSCNRPDNVAVSNLQPTSVQFNWTGSSNSYEVAFGPSGFDPDSTEGEHQIVAANSIALSGLTPQAAYDFYVRSLCSNPTDTSTWTFAYTFVTPCMPQEIPYSEDFETYASGSSNPINACWTKGTNSSTAYPYPYSTNVVNGQRSLYFYATHPSSSTSTAYYSYAALPLMNAPVDSLQVTFKMRRYTTTSDTYTSRIVVGLMSDPADIATFTPVDTIDMKDEPSLAVRGYEVRFEGHSNEGQFIAFYDAVPPLYGSASNSYSYVYLDDIVVDYIPTCPSPVDVTIPDSTITGTSAVVAWTDRVNADLGYELEYGPAGFELGTGTRVQSNTNPTTLTGLMGSTNYEVYVRPICSATDSGAWSFPVQFATICVGITVTPFAIDFESEATGTSAEFPHCWTRFNDCTGSYTYYPYVYNSTTYAHSGTNCLYFYSYGTSSYADNQIASLPEIDTNVLPMNSLELHFWGRGSTTTTYMSQVIVGVMSNPSNLATFQAVDTVNMNATLTEYVVDFSNFNGTGSYVSILAVKPSTTTYNYAYLDDITLQQVPDCPSVADITIADVDSNMLSLTWTDSVNTVWSLEYGPEGFVPGTGTTINVSSLPVTVNGLATGTRYTFIVTPDCMGLVYPTAATFRTAGTYYEVPFVTNFEDATQDYKWEMENGTNINAWNIGTATGNVGPRSLYISNDQGSSYAYSLSSAGLSYAYVNLNLPAGDYGYSFDWKAQGESTYDYIQVALVPVYEDLEAINGTGVPTGMTATAVPESWISLHPGVKLNLDSVWSTVSDVITIDQSGIYHLVFAWRNDGGGGSQPPAAIDNISFSLSTCARPTDLVASNVTTHDATISWIEMGTATQWLYTIDGGEEQLASATHVTFNNLASSTMHRFQVRSLCGEGDTSFAVELQFSTLCDLFSAVDTFYEDFESYNGVAYNVEGEYPTCWDVYSNGTDSKYISHVTGSGSYWYPNSGSKCMTLTSGSGATHGDTKVVRLPEFAEPVNTLTVSWYMATESSSSGSLSVGYMVGDDYTTDFVPIKTIPASATTISTSGGLFDTVSFEEVPDSAMYIAFMWYHNSTFYSCCIDDIKVSTSMNCFVPADRNVATTSTSATISWNNSGEYNVAYRLESETDWSEDQHIYDATSVTLTNLVPASTYLYRMQKICLEGDTSDYATGSFVTDSMFCVVPTGLAVSDVQHDAVTLAWTAESDDAEYVAHVFSSHHDVYDTVTGATTTITGLYAAEEYQVAIQRSCGFGYYSEWGDTLSFTTPTCEPVSNVAAAAIEGTTSVSVSWTAAAGSDTWQIEYGYDGFGQGEGTIITVNTNPCVITGLDADMPYEFYVRTFCGEGWTSNWSNAANATTSDFDVTCGTVEGVNVNVDGNYVVINWNEVENALSYDLEYGAVGFSLGQGTNVDNLSALAYSITDMPNGNYEVYVRANCGETNYGPWSESVTFSVLVGINDAEGDMQLSLYPNPATNVTTISLSGFAGKVNVQVVDLNGRVAASENMECDGNCVKTMNVNNLAQGTYFVRVYGDTVNMVRKLVVR